MTGLSHDASAFTWNKVLVFNLGFDRKGAPGVHWVYFPDPARSFYRIGYYDNIFETDRMSLYVELGFARDAAVDIDAMRARVLDDLRAEGVLTDQRLVASHARLKTILQAHGVYPIGRYGGWTYCSIEDNIVEARALCRDFDAA
jgi:hypothetical protein